MKKMPIRGREAKRWSQREQNWTKVSSLMPHQQLSNQHVAPVLNELHGPTVHIPPTSVFPFLALFVLHLLSPGKWTQRIHSAPQIKSYYIVIFHHHFVAPSLYILLTPSVSLFPPPACFRLGHPVPLRKGYMV